jgi:hypothetical protein
MSKEERGFASMNRASQREIASKGGRAAHQKGTAHEWTREEARRAQGWLEDLKEPGRGREWASPTDDQVSSAFVDRRPARV